MSLILRGLGASPGIAIGVVQIIENIRQFSGEFPDRAVLVARTTDPRFVLYMLRAGAIVTELGGRLCHTAIVALELGVPCVVGVAEASSRLKNGMIVRVDGQAGTVCEHS